MIDLTDIAKKLLDLSAALPPGEWRAFRDPKYGVENAGDTGVVLRYEHSQEGLGLLGPYRPAWSTCEFVALARNHIEELAKALIEAPGEREKLIANVLEETKKIRLEVCDILDKELDSRDAVIASLRTQLEVERYRR